MKRVPLAVLVIVLTGLLVWSLIPAGRMPSRPGPGGEPLQAAADGGSPGGSVDRLGDARTDQLSDPEGGEQGEATSERRVDGPGSMRQPILGVLEIVTDRGQELERGVLVVVPITDELANRVESDLSFSGAELDEVAPIQRYPIEQGRANEIEWRGYPRFLAWVESPGYLVEGRIIEGQPPEKWVVEKCKGLEIEVLDPDDKPLQGATVHVYYDASDSDYVNWSLDKKLLSTFYYRRRTTGPDGRVRIEMPFHDPMTVNVEAGQGMKAPIRYGVLDGDDLVVPSFPAATIWGRVHADGRPIENGIVAFFQGEDGRTIEAGAADIEEDGSYSCEAVRADRPVLRGIAFASGMAMASKVVAAPVPGSTYQVDFDLEPGASADLVCLFPNGEPVPDLGLYLSSDGFDWTPGAYQTDGRGRAKTDDVLVPGHEYTCYWLSGGARGPASSFVMPDPKEGGEQELVVVRVPSLGRFSEILVGGSPLSDDDWTVSLFPGSDGTEFLWTSSDPGGPWVPAGPCLALLEEGGRVLSNRIVVEQGDNGPLVFDQEMSTVTFSLPRSEQEDRWQVEALWNNLVVASGSGLSGERMELEVPPGRILIRLEGKGRGSFCFGPFEVGEGGLALGSLPLPGCTLTVRVEDQDGHGLPATAVSLRRDDGWRSGQQLTAENGEVLFPDLYAGYYEVKIDPMRSHLISRPAQTQWVQVRGDGSSDTVRFVLGARDGQVVDIPGHLDPPVYSFAVDGCWKEEGYLAGEGLAKMGELNPGAWYGKYSVGPGRIQIIGGRLVGAAVQPGPPLEKSVKLIGRDGRELASCPVAIEVDGCALLNHSAFTLADGTLQMSVASGMSIHLILSLPDGGVCKVDFSEIPVSGSWEIPASAKAENLTVVDFENMPVPMAALFHPRLRRRFIADELGRLSVPGLLPSDRVTVAADGFWPAEFEDADLPVFVLRRVVRNARLRVPAGLPIDSLHLELVERLRSTRPVPSTATQEAENQWQVPPCPQGRYRIQGFDQEGQLVLDQVVMIAQGEDLIQVR